MITLSSFLSEWTGRGVNLPEDKNPYGFQCVELVNEWLKELGLNPEPFTNAQDFDDHYKLYDPTTLVYIPNTPLNVPKTGDIVIWQGTGLPFGHVAIFVHGDVNTFTSFDQNWPSGSLPHLQSHTYWNVEGWLHPLMLDPVIDPKDTLIAQLQGQLAAQTAEVAVLQGRITDALAKIAAIRNLVQ